MPILDDMYGEDNTAAEIYDTVFADKKISAKAKEWLKNLREG